eukprot:scaffold644_cov357-Pavlova_lutheri.AAC.10
MQVACREPASHLSIPYNSLKFGPRFRGFLLDHTPTSGPIPIRISDTAFPPIRGGLKGERSSHASPEILPRLVPPVSRGLLPPFDRADPSLLTGIDSGTDPRSLGSDSVVQMASDGRVSSSSARLRAPRTAPKGAVSCVSKLLRTSRRVVKGPVESTAGKKRAWVRAGGKHDAEGWALRDGGVRSREGNLGLPAASTRYESEQRRGELHLFEAAHASRHGRAAERFRRRQLSGRFWSALQPRLFRRGEQQPPEYLLLS